MNEYFESCARHQTAEYRFNEKFEGWMFAQNWKVPEDLQYDCAFLCMGWEL